MSVFGTNQVEELIIGNAVASETTVATFIASASDQEIKVLSADGSAPAAGDDFQVFQKTANGYEYSQKIKPAQVEKVVLKEYVAEVQKSVTATVDSASANTTYVLEVVIYGDMSRENFDVVSGYYTTGASAPTVTAIRDGLIDSINKNLTKRGGNEVTVTANSTDAIDIEGVAQTVVVGKKQGKQIDFTVKGKSFTESVLVPENTGAISVVVNNENNPGAGTGKFAVNLEWFLNGFKYDVYRETAYPADFTAPQYASLGTNYNAIHIIHYNTRKSTIQENQRRVTTILVARANLAGNAVTNSVLADLRTVLGSANVPSNLATS
jgi:hypothetical protein